MTVAGQARLSTRYGSGEAGRGDDAVARENARRVQARISPLCSRGSGLPLGDRKAAELAQPWRLATERQVGRSGLGAALAKAGVIGEGTHRVRFHDLRHTFASLLIAQGADVVFVSRQMGHANPSITLSVLRVSVRWSPSRRHDEAGTGDRFGAVLAANGHVAAQRVS